MLTPIFEILKNTGLLEWSCNLTSLACVILAARNHVLTWLFGIISCVLFTYFFMTAKLYAEAVLQLFFIATSLWGWWHWSEQTTKPAAPIQAIVVRSTVLSILIAVGMGILYALGLQQFTDAASPWVDSQILTLSILAQWWLMQRKIATWPLWLIVNSLSVPLYFSREFYVSSVFYSLYWCMAIIAYFNWRKHLLNPS
jgi:nicotinamide mononucleotide transporter